MSHEGPVKDSIEELGVVDRLGSTEWCEIDSNDIARVNPFYACIVENGERKPLPIAIAEGNKNALAFRDAWLKQATSKQKSFCDYDEKLRNFVGGAEGEQQLPASDAPK